MKALILSNYKQLEVVETSKPSPVEDELLIRIAACGICGSDVHGYDGSTGRRIPPIIMGHEAAGIVEAVGADVTGFQPGDHVTFDSTVFCGKCFFCLRGQVNLCDERQVIGVSTPNFRRMGAFAEYVTVPARIGYHLPDNMPFAHAALIEALSVAVHAIFLSTIGLEDTVVIIGAGMIGLLALQVVSLAGAGAIFVVDIDDSRLELARNLGATCTFNSRTTSTVYDLLQRTVGRGADIVLECVGTSTTVKLAIDIVRKGGVVTLVGNIAPSIEMALQSVVTRQIRLQGSCASSGEYSKCISLISRGAVRVEPLLSAIAPLEEGAMWFQRLHQREARLLKVVLQP